MFVIICQFDLKYVTYMTLGATDLWPATRTGTADTATHGSMDSRIWVWNFHILKEIHRIFCVFVWEGLVGGGAEWRDL